MRSPLFILSATLALIHSALGRSSTGDRVLVVLESQVNQDDYSKFFASLKGASDVNAHVVYRLMFQTEDSSSPSNRRRMTLRS